MKSNTPQRINEHDWKTVRYKNIVVDYLNILDGGGKDQFNQEFVLAVKDLFGKVNTICEFACGPGFIGFSLLAHGLCEKLCLIDINPLAIEACKKTINKNHLEKKVVTYLSDTLDSVPKNVKWDLVVSNPPHFDGKYTGRPGEIILVDPKWQIHKKFYSQITKHLTKNGSVLISENPHGSNPRIFKGMISENGLTFMKSFNINLPKTMLQILKMYSKKINFESFKYILSLFGRVSFSPSLFLLHKNSQYYIWSKKISLK